jgi:hypothetical protein
VSGRGECTKVRGKRTERTLWVERSGSTPRKPVNLSYPPCLGAWAYAESQWKQGRDNGGEEGVGGSRAGMLAHPFSFVDDLRVLPPNPLEKQRILRSEERSVAQKLVNIKAGAGS